MNQDSDSELTAKEKEHRQKLLSYDADSEYASIYEYFEEEIHEEKDVRTFHFFCLRHVVDNFTACRTRKVPSSLTRASSALETSASRSVLELETPRLISRHIATDTPKVGFANRVQDALMQLLAG